MDKSNIVSSNNIILDEQKTDVTITESGIYTITGIFNHFIVVDGENVEVELILNNVTIENSKTATVVGLNANKITINLKEETIY